MKCNCLEIFEIEEIRQLVSLWGMKFGKKNYHEQKQIVADWIRYGQGVKKHNTRKDFDYNKIFNLPFDITNRISTEAADLFKNKICVSALLLVIGYGRKKWLNICKSIDGCMHGNK